MTTPKEMAAFLEKLPDAAIAVLVVQAGRHPTVIRTESLDLPIIFPNWPKATWLGITDAINGTEPPPEDKEPPDNGKLPGTVL